MKKFFIFTFSIAVFFACNKSVTKEVEPVRMYTTDDTWALSKINSYSVSQLPDGSRKINQIESAVQGIFDEDALITVSAKNQGPETYDVRSGDIRLRITEDKLTGQVILNADGKSTDLLAPGNFQALNEKQKFMIGYTLALVNDLKSSQAGIVRNDHSKNMEDTKNLRIAEPCSQTFINIGNTSQQAAYLNTIEMSSWSNAHISTHEYLSHTCGTTCLSGTVACVSICTVYYSCSN